MSVEQAAKRGQAGRSELQVLSEFPRPICEIENEWIPMPDGTRLAAKIWRPVDSPQRPVPAILEYLPYRKRDGTVTRDSMTHAYYAGHGYAGVRVDIRGTGDSEGILEDEYTHSELADGLAVLEWLAAQPWCDGRCGVMGISWGGFNGLQLAALQPPQLKAVVSICSTDDRYADDVHYMGGCLLGDNLSWAGTMLGYMTLPPDPAVVGERWRAMWMERLEAASSWLLPWLTHQSRDDYWRHGSICEDFSQVRTPIMAVSGWADPYTNSVFRLLESLPPEVPRQGLVGPWAHKYPHLGVPGPAIGFLQETLRWWDKYLKGQATGIEHEPMLRLYLQDSMPPSTGYQHRPGRWISEPSWPSPNVDQLTYAFTTDRYTLAMEPTGEPAPTSEQTSRNMITLRSPITLGYFGGKWCGESAPPDLPDDQREEDGGAVLFESPPLTKPLSLVGAPSVQLELESDQPVAMVAVRLSDVLPDGRVTRLTYGLLNLTHRDGHAEPQPLQPGRRYQVHIPLNYFAQSFPVGHRVRLAVSSSYWPQAWLPPKQTTLRLHSANCQVTLPVRKFTADEPVVNFLPPAAAAAIKPELIATAERSWKVIRDIGAGKSALEVRKGRGRQYWRAIDLERSSVGRESYRVDHQQIESAVGEVSWEHWLERGDWRAVVKTHTRLTGDCHCFRLQFDIDAYLNERRIFSRSQQHLINRHGV